VTWVAFQKKDASAIHDLILWKIAGLGRETQKVPSILYRNVQA
jgi:hypothetical protein